ncbi:MAG: GAF domain-containing protein, partial [Gemmatimonadales bacterium]
MRDVVPRESDEKPAVELQNGRLVAKDDTRTVVEFERPPGYWLEIEPHGTATDIGIAVDMMSHVLESEAEVIQMTGELADRYEEIDLLYTIAETLGRTLALGDACRVILREVSSVVGARRASILVSDADRQLLFPVAGLGVDVTGFDPIAIDDETSVAARAFREGRTLSGATRGPEPGVHTERQYRGEAYLSVPILYPDSESIPEPIGVINLTDRAGRDVFNPGHRKLIDAVAHQIGAAIQNARLVDRDKTREALNRELELAHDLQAKLIPNLDLRGDFEVATRCEPIEFVGGDFYKFFRLSEGKA